MLPRWWPSVYLDVKEIEPPDAHGLGRRVRLLTKGWLPYTLRWESVIVESSYPYGYVLDATGDFVGRGVWTFAQDDRFVNVTYDWRVSAEKPLLRLMSPLLKPIFEANHRWAMKQGEASLTLELARLAGGVGCCASGDSAATRSRDLCRRRADRWSGTGRRTARRVDRARSAPPLIGGVRGHGPARGDHRVEPILDRFPPLARQPAHRKRREPDPARERRIEILLAAIAHFERNRFDLQPAAAQCHRSPCAEQMQVRHRRHAEALLKHLPKRRRGQANGRTEQRQPPRARRTVAHHRGRAIRRRWRVKEVERRQERAGPALQHLAWVGGLVSELRDERPVGRTLVALCDAPLFVQCSMETPAGVEERRCQRPPVQRRPGWIDRRDPGANGFDSRRALRGCDHAHSARKLRISR